MLILWLFLAAVLLFCYSQRKPRNFPPGPPRLPLIGSLPFVIKYKTLFLRIIGISEEYGSICGFYIGSRPIVILGNLDIIKQVYKTEEASLRPPTANSKFRYGNSRGTGSKGILFSSGEGWREQRRFALKNLRDFGFGKASMEDMIQKESTKLCNLLKKDLDVPTKIGSKLNVSIVNALWLMLVGEELSLDDPAHLKVVSVIDTFVRGSGNPNSAISQLCPSLVQRFPKFFLPNFVAAFKQISNLTAKQRQEHREHHDPQNLSDFLSVHIEAQRTAQPGSSFYGITGKQNEEINLIDLFLAGTETTSTTINWGILYLLHHPQVQARVHEELDEVVGRDRIPSLQDEPKLKYLTAVLMEIQRSACIVFAGVPHYTETDVEVDGYTIPRGSVIFANLVKVMYNPEVFKDPEVFNPERFLDSEGNIQTTPHYIPFLVGKRVCLGSSLAEKELYLFMAQLLHTFSFHPVPGEKLPSYSLRPKDGITPDNIIRFCPTYNLILKERF